MTRILKFVMLAAALIAMLAVDMSFVLENNLPIPFKRDLHAQLEQLVPNAEAILGVRRRTRRRTAVVVGSAAAASTAAAQQQAYEAQQQAAAAQQQIAAQQPVAASSQPIIPVGSAVKTLPGNCKAVTVNNTSYSDCGGVFYQQAYQGSNLVYVVVAKPI
jgi:hypothetical protein